MALKMTGMQQTHHLANLTVEFNKHGVDISSSPPPAPSALVFRALHSIMRTASTGATAEVARQPRLWPEMHTFARSCVEFKDHLATLLDSDTGCPQQECIYYYCIYYYSYYYSYYYYYYYYYCCYYYYYYYYCRYYYHYYYDYYYYYFYFY